MSSSESSSSESSSSESSSSESSSLEEEDGSSYQEHSSKENEEDNTWSSPVTRKSMDGVPQTPKRKYNLMSEQELENLLFSDRKWVIEYMLGFAEASRIYPHNTILVRYEDLYRLWQARNLNKDFGWLYLNRKRSPVEVVMAMLSPRIVYGYIRRDIKEYEI